MSQELMCPTCAKKDKWVTFSTALKGEVQAWCPKGHKMVPVGTDKECKSKA